MSAVQLAQIMGALAVYAVDINADKLALAGRFGAVTVDASQGDPVAEIRRLTGGRGVDVALEVIGLKQTMEQAVRSLAVLGRAVLAGICDRPFEIDSYRDLLGREAEVIGCSDHTLWELEVLVEYARQGRLDLSHVAARTVLLEAGVINTVMDNLEGFGGEARTVIKP
jgi:propanol-preferring alcohol dehydrogenase